MILPPHLAGAKKQSTGQQTQASVPPTPPKFGGQLPTPQQAPQQQTFGLGGASAPSPQRDAGMSGSFNTQPQPQPQQQGPFSALSGQLQSKPQAQPGAPASFAQMLGANQGGQQQFQQWGLGGAGLGAQPGMSGIQYDRGEQPVELKKSPEEMKLEQMQAAAGLEQDRIKGEESAAASDMEKLYQQMLGEQESSKTERLGTIDTEKAAQMDLAQRNMAALQRRASTVNAAMGRGLGGGAAGLQRQALVSGLGMQQGVEANAAAARRGVLGDADASRRALLMDMMRGKEEGRRYGTERGERASERATGAQWREEDIQRGGRYRNEDFERDIELEKIQYGGGSKETQDRVVQESAQQSGKYPSMSDAQLKKKIADASGLVQQINAKAWQAELDRRAQFGKEYG